MVIEEFYCFLKVISCMTFTFWLHFKKKYLDDFGFDNIHVIRCFWLHCTSLSLRKWQNEKFLMNIRIDSNNWIHVVKEWLNHVMFILFWEIYAMPATLFNILLFIFTIGDCFIKINVHYLTCITYYSVRSTEQCVRNETLLYS